ncbi:hypothetical protein N9D23_01970 [Rubripirellula sp.]|nr:hypothetical protein [Planctomycetaceae bacterium]MDA9856859.1 hypothetical protein [Rubripirellula sp.]MDF1845187.1 hypothetical protein [Rubripirellula sp.]
MATARPNLLRQFSESGYLTMGAGKFVQGPGESKYFDEHQSRVAAMRRELHQRLKQSGGLSIRLGFKRNHGAGKRNPAGSERAEFPPHSTQN